MSNVNASNDAPGASEGTANSSNQEQINAHVDLAIVLALHAWPALTVAVQNTWGGPDSSEKRDWLAGVVSDLFQSEPQTDQEDVEVVLLQVMQDEFDVNVEDSSEEIVAKEIMRLRQQCINGDFEEVRTLQKKWEEKQRTGGDAAYRNLQVVENNAEDEGSSDDEDDEEEQDVEMGDAQQSGSVRPPKEKVVPEVDEDGFTTVVSKKKR